MKIRILTITHKLPAWVSAGYEDYVKRLPASCKLELVEIPAEKRHAQTDLSRVLLREEEKLLAAIKPTHHVIALAVEGNQWSTPELAAQLQQWQQTGHHVDLLIGGPEGLTPACLQRANQHWSLSRLTFPHFLVRVILAEQFYRAQMILTGHPYHR